MTQGSLAQVLAQPDGDQQVGMDLLLSMSQPEASGPPAAATAQALPDLPRPASTAAPVPRRILRPLPLLALLAVQAVLSARLLRTDTAFADEALYLWIGHLEWAHVLHGVPLPPFATYLSGSPVFYPPVGALADSIGGLAGARALNMCFMLGATALLWATAARLYGRRAAFFAAGLWSVLGPTQHVGAFATYDAMAFLLLVAAAWCVVRAGPSNDGMSWAMLAALLLAMANCTKYATALFDPVVIALAVLAAYPRPGGRKAFMRGAIVACYTAMLLVLLITLATAGNRDYLIGIDATTLTRAVGTTPPLTVLREAWSWTFIIGTVAVAGTVLALRRERTRQRRLLAATLAVAGILAPLNQARIHTDVSLIKHTDFGAWFAAILAGYALAAIMAQGRTLRIAGAAAGMAAMVAAAAVGSAQARGFYNWPDSARVLAIMKPLMATTRGPILFQNPAIMEYYFGVTTQWPRITGANSIRLPGGKTIDDDKVGSQGVPGPYLRFIRSGYFKVIALNDYIHVPFDAAVIATISSDPHYVVAGRTSWQDGNFIIWKYR